MANSSVQKAVGDEIRKKLPEEGVFKRRKLTNFREKKLRLLSGGEFKFDAVDESNIAAVNISASRGLTRTTNKPQSGTINKIYKDIYFLQLAKVDVRAVVFAQKTAFDVFDGEQKKGRIPRDINLLHVAVSASLQKRLEEAGQKASDEVNPKKRRA